MKILHTVEFYHPSVGGMQAVVRELSERLVALGHEVTVATSFLPERKLMELNGVKIVDFKISGRAASGYEAEAGEIERYQKLLLEGDFDVVANFAAQQWATDIALPLLPKIKARKIFIPTGFSGLYLPLFQKYFSDLKEWIKHYDWQIFLSNDYRDINFVRDLGLNKFSVIPNGAAASEFLAPVNFDIRSELGIPADHFLIVHVGSHTGWKGHAAAQQMFERANLPHSTLLIIGNSFSDSGGCAQTCQQAAENWSQTRAFSERDQRLLVLELSREQTVAALKSAQLFLFPSNIECSPLVLFEAMASRLPFLTTAVGNAAEIIDWSGGGELLPTRDRVYINENRLKFIVKSIIIYCQSWWRGQWPKSTYSEALIRPSVRQLESLYRDPKRRERLAQQGFAAWQEKFTWKKIAQEYEKIYKSK